MSKRSRAKAARWQLSGSGMEAKGWLPAMALALALLGVAFLTWLLPSVEANTAAPDVAIQRVMTSNPQVCYRVEGKYYDWIELQNISENTVDLDGWKLTDTGDLRSAFVLKKRTLAPGQTLVVYCDEAPEGYAGDAVFTGFRLSADGEVLLLADPQMRTSGVNVPPLRKGFVYQRDPVTGEYASAPFDGVSDSERAGRAHAREFDPGEIMISEIMPMNRSMLTDGDGDFSDWIELYNPKAEPVNLESWALTDDDNKLVKWMFPAKVIQPGEYLVVFCSGKNRKDPAGELHTNFKLSRKGETIRLSNPAGEVVSQVKFERMDADQSLCRETDGSMTGELAPSPRTANLAPGQQGDSARTLVNVEGLYINEIYFGGDGPDWVELYNSSDRGIDLSGAGLSDNPGKLRKWQFPNGAAIPAGGYIVVQLKGSSANSATSTTQADVVSVVPVIHPAYTADFGLASGETLCLSTVDGRLVDRVVLSGKNRAASMGRAQGYDTLRFFSELTPGAANASRSYSPSMGQLVTFSPAPGVIHQDSVEVTLSCDLGVDIYYTTDGSVPTKNSPVYRAPIRLTKNTMLRAVADVQDVLDPQPKTGSYIFGPHTLRTVVVTGREKDLTSSGGSLNTGVKGEGCDVFVEMYDESGMQLISQQCHFMLTGHDSRVKNTQKSFKLNARRASGDNRFQAKLFSKREYPAVKNVTIRSTGQDYKSAHMLDSVLTSLAEGTHVMYQESEPCVVYVNNQYWGVYNIREHVDSHSISQFEGWNDPDGVTIILGDGDSARATTGSSKQYKAFWKWLKSADLTKASDMEIMKQNFCIESYLDYVIIEMFVNNSDLGNIRAYRSATEDPRWHYILFDLDLSFRNKKSDPANTVKCWFSEKVGSTTSQETLPFRKLMQVQEVREYFLARAGELLATNLTSKNIVSKIEARRALIKDEMVNNCKRWDWKYSSWESAVDRIVNYAKSRPAKMVGYFQEAFKLSDAEMQHYFGDAIAIIQAEQAGTAPTTVEEGPAGEAEI